MDSTLPWTEINELADKLSLYDASRLIYLVRDRSSQISKSRRLGLYPISRVPDFLMAKMLLSNHWVADEARLDKDQEDYEELTDDERRPLEYAFGFFAVGDGTVSEIVLDFLINTAESAEERLFYTYQITNEAVHNEAYGLMINTLIKDPTRKEEIFSAVEKIQSIGAINDFAEQILKKRGGKKQLYFIQMIMEYLIFTPLFCVIYWYKAHKQGKLLGIISLNEWVARDEGLHAQFAALKYRQLSAENRYTRKECLEILNEAISVSDQFTEETFQSINLPELSTKNVKEYVRFVADDLLDCIGEEKYYHATNPFVWMEYHKYITKHNFYERNVTEYAKFDPYQATKKAMELSGFSKDQINDTGLFEKEENQVESENWF